MKIRSGLVSYSSSSSFVCIGVDISGVPKLTEKFVDDFELSEEGEKVLPKNTGYFYYEGCGEIIGWELGNGSSDDGSFGCEDVDFEELKKYADALEQATGIRPKLMGGTYAS